MTAALVTPVYLFVSAGVTTEPPRADPPPPSSFGRTLASALRIPSYRNAVPILVYHEVSTSVNALQPSLFAGQMALLHQQGFHTVTIRQLAAFLLRHSTLPERPVAITFDEPLGSLWRNADPILEEYGFVATAF